MPYWTTNKLQEQIDIAKQRLQDEAEFARWHLSNLQPPVPQVRKWDIPTETPQFNLPQPQQEIPQWSMNVAPEPTLMSQNVMTRPVSPTVETPSISETPTKKEERKPVIPFWQRALQVFSAPFDWVDENVIKPGLAIGATTIGALEDVERLPGEDYFEWKKRSWEKWQAPGVDIKVPWGDGDIRIDLKGVLEFAPWFLLPGAGQVGTATRAGMGAAGALGKLGKVGRVVGTAVEFSPWGIVEKGTSAAIKGVIKGSAKLGARTGEKVFGAIPEKEVSPAAQEFTKFFKESVAPKYAEFQKAKPQVYARGEAITREIFARQRKGEITGVQAVDEARKALRGIGIKSEFSVPPWERAAIQKNTKEIMDEMVKASERGYVNLEDSTALLDLLSEGILPEPANIKAFAKVFGKEFAESVSKLRGVKKSTVDNIIDFMNLPRAILASVDISAVGRQGLILGLVHPTKVPRSFGRMIKSLFSEKMALGIDDTMRADPLFNEFVQVAKGYIAPIREATLRTAEESFASNVARTFPLIRRSERAFITYLNELRFGAYKTARNAVKATGGGDKELQVLGRFINLASGRGDLPKSLDKFAPALNTILFSPRLQAATLELPVQLGKMFLSKNPYMRKEAAKALVTFVGGGAALLTLLQKAGVAKVETDPRSSEFGKVVIGDTRLDIWRGYVQYIRFATQLLTGQKKSAYGNMSKRDRFQTAFSFMQSKSSPAFGLMVDLLKGENYRGDPLFEGTTGTLKAARERIMPLAIQDITDAMEQSGINGLWTALPATIGIGTLTYIDEYTKTQNRIAQENGYDVWSEIDPKAQREIFNRSKELQAARIQLDRRVMESAWGEWRLAGNAIEDVFRQNVEQITAQYRTTGDGVKFRGRINDAFTARRGGYDAREKDERFQEIVERFKIEDTAEALVALSPEQLAIRTYNDALYGDDMYDEFGEYRFDEAKLRKEQLRTALGDDMFNYVEDYQGVKYETFPPEFQEFQKAKEVMKPYFEVRSEVERMFGKMFMESNGGQRLISKLRKQIRLTNPEIARYYDMFYSQP